MNMDGQAAASLQDGQAKDKAHVWVCLPVDDPSKWHEGDQSRGMLQSVKCPPRVYACACVVVLVLSSMCAGVRKSRAITCRVGMSPEDKCDAECAVCR
jgi:hypothetical protein